MSSTALNDRPRGWVSAKHFDDIIAFHKNDSTFRRRAKGERLKALLKTKSGSCRNNRRRHGRGNRHRPRTCSGNSRHQPTALVRPQRLRAMEHRFSGWRFGLHVPLLRIAYSQGEKIMTLATLSTAAAATRKIGNTPIWKSFFLRR